MSTKSTIGCTAIKQKRRYLKARPGKMAEAAYQAMKQAEAKTSVHFHLYTDSDDNSGPDKGMIYLELEGQVYFDASPNRVVVGVPPKVWREIVTQWQNRT